MSETPSSESAVDPIIIAIFGPAPDGLDLTQSQLVSNSAAAITCTVVAAVTVGLRLWARRMQGVGTTVDDWILMVALAFVFGTAGLAIGGCKFGAGRHVWSVSHTELAMIFKLLFSYTYVWSVSVSAISLLLFYRRIFTRGTTWFYVRLWSVMFLCVGYPVTCWLYMALACQPASFFWEQFLGYDGMCGDTSSAFMALTVINMVNDILVLCVPIPEILNLQMSGSRKAGVAGIMLLGSFVCIASIVRISTYAGFMVTVDKTWDLGKFFLWSSLEPAIGVVCACLPTLRPLVTRFTGRMASAADPKSTMGASSGGTKAKRSRAGSVGVGVAGVAGVGGSRPFTSDTTHAKFDDRDQVGDEMMLTSIGKGAGPGSVSDRSSIPDEGAVSRSDTHEHV